MEYVAAILGHDVASEMRHADISLTAISPVGFRASKWHLIYVDYRRDVSCQFIDAVFFYASARRQSSQNERCLNNFGGMRPAPHLHIAK